MGVFCYTNVLRRFLELIKIDNHELITVKRFQMDVRKMTPPTIAVLPLVKCILSHEEFTFVKEKTYVLKMNDVMEQIYQYPIIAIVEHRRVGKRLIPKLEYIIKKDYEMITYKLFAVITSHRGHFNAYLRKAKGWYRMDDTQSGAHGITVSKKDGNTVFYKGTIPGSDGIVYPAWNFAFYRRTDIVKK